MGSNSNVSCCSRSKGCLIVCYTAANGIQSGLDMARDDVNHSREPQPSGDADGASVSPPTELLTELWSTYGRTLTDCHFTDAVVGDLWQSYGALLQHHRTPLAPAGVEVSVPMTVANHDFRYSTTAVFEIAWEQLDAAQQRSVLEVPATLIPLLEFLKAVTVWGEAQSPSLPYATLDVRKVRLVCMIRGGPATTFDKLGANAMNRFVFLRGTIVRLSLPRLKCQYMPFRCTTCGAKVIVDVGGGPLQFPTGCTNGKCKGYRFAPLASDAVVEETQQIKLQEEVRDASSHGGSASNANGDLNSASSASANRVMEVELRGPLMDSVSAGDTVCIGGILSARRLEGRHGGEMRTMVILASSVSLLGNHASRRSTLQRGRSGGGVSSGASLGPHMLELASTFYDMANHDTWFYRLVNSFAPGIVGMTAVKAALLLAMAGGTTKGHVRGQIHVLLVGDPGLGKSQLLRAAAAVAPRSSLATATTSSSCGLTITLARDPQSGETTFEAGAVIHGDGGITCIDEIDKGTNEHKALLEVMEQGSISIAKAGALFRMPVETSVIAAGNPCGGKFEFHKTLSENINISAPLLSRFDVIFLLSDCMRAGEADMAELPGLIAPPSSSSESQLQPAAAPRQQTVTNHVLRMHRQQFHAPSSGKRGQSDGSGLIPVETVSQFLQFVRETCRPRMTVDAAVLLREAYLEARQQFAAGGMLQLPITPRYLQSLIRLSEAKAKLSLRHEVSEADATFAVALMRSGSSSYQAAMTNSRQHAGSSSSSQRGATGVAALGGGIEKPRGKLNVKELAIKHMEAQLASSAADGLTHDQVIECCAEAGHKNPNALLHQLNESGAILLRGGRYRLKMNR